MRKFAAIDVGGTAIKYALISESAEILEHGEVPTDVKDLNSYVSLLISIYEKYEDQAEALVMSAPGKIDSKTGFFYTGGALKFMDGVNLKDEILKRKSMKFCVANDGRCAAFAELWKGSMQGVNNGIVMTLGTGIGACLILNGKPYEGSTSAAGEVSTIPLHWDRKYDRHQLWYRQQGVGYLSARYAEMTGADTQTINGRILFSDYQEGKKEAAEVLKQYCDSLAAGIFGLQAILDLERVAIGGGISRQKVLFELLDSSLDETFAEAHGFPEARPAIVPCTFTSDANMIGALYNYLFLQ